MGSFVVIVAHSTEDPNRAASALWTAARLGEAGHRVDLWLHGEGVRLGVQHVAETLREPFEKSAAEMIESLAARGSALHCSKPCFTQRGFAEDALRKGARLAEPVALADLVAAGATPLTL